MAPTSRNQRQQSRASFHPSNDTATYRDLLLFEERLKTNAAQLQRRKSRYQLFLFHLLIAIAFLLSEVLLQTSFLDIPYTNLLRKVLPDVYGGAGNLKPHPYFASGLLFVLVTALLLFFASGMYAEKIAYANRYVPHANKALRNFNMYLNVRRPPLRSAFSISPFPFVFHRPTQSRAPSPTPRPSNAPAPMAPIPPANSPRGELIFSSRVDRGFRESYERYRAAFERRRDERERDERGKTWTGRIANKMPWNQPPNPPPALAALSRTASGRGRGSIVGTPLGSRRSSPMPRPGTRDSPAVRTID
ncbi:hypothetical protein DFJ58DRAFT_785864 [Suillus subalutaceus]|uniref:uncharacterized protein n=1 Tax=Suillus subalutaceus TaxID=48586 RepID=UPI001B880BB2|nr:uncharacterized protein DFJ58DRAFT_785864 [Suillus subalutaceus]KAG1855647.1 hypothetical protein DFJ58DRAFT_785864 [Suillus subalutaceus]